MSPELSRYFKEGLDELRADMKQLIATQHKMDKEIDRLKWKNGLMGLIGGALSALGFKISGLFP